MNIDALFTDPEYGNFVCVYLGLAFVGQVLEPYTRDGIQQVHQKIQTVLVGQTKCTGTCANNPSSWCSSCKDWQRNLKRFSKYQDIDWKKQAPSKWSLAFEHIASIFASNQGDGSAINFRDLSNACSIWSRCKEFNIQSFALQNVKDCRNKYFAHNDTLRVTDIGKARVFDALKDLLSETDVQTHINKQECLNELETIKNGNYMPMEIKTIGEEIQKTRGDGQKIIKILTKLISFGTEDKKVLQRIQYFVNERQQLDHVDLRDNITFIFKIPQTILLYMHRKYLYVFYCILVVGVLVFLLLYLRGAIKPEMNVVLFGNDNDKGTAYLAHSDNERNPIVAEFIQGFNEWAAEVLRWKTEFHACPCNNATEPCCADDGQ